MTTPLRGSEHGAATPESLFLSALIEEGDFNPRRYSITVEDFDCWQELFNFCLDHQEHAGRAPSPDLVRKRYPEFEMARDVSPIWAAKELREESNSRMLRTAMREATALIGQGSVREAQELMTGLRLPQSSRRPPSDGFDATTVEDEFATTRIPVPFPTLGRTNGGIGNGELWYLGARLGQGKSNTATAYVARAAQEGFSAAYFSLEMPAAQILGKIRRVLSARDLKLQARLESDELATRKDALEELRASVPGNFFAFDPSHGRCTPDEVEAAMSEYDLVFVDHVGLMTDARGRRAIEDWRIQAEISNRLKEATLRTSGRLLALTQINRSGHSENPERTPKASEVAGSDDIPRDADVLITMQRYSTSVMKHYTEKNRNQGQVHWFSMYEPGRGNFVEITGELADTVKGNDELRN